MTQRFKIKTKVSVQLTEGFKKHLLFGVEKKIWHFGSKNDLPIYQLIIFSSIVQYHETFFEFFLQ